MAASWQSFFLQRSFFIKTTCGGNLACSCEPFLRTQLRSSTVVHSLSFALKKLTLTSRYYHRSRTGSLNAIFKKSGVFLLPLVAAGALQSTTWSGSSIRMDTDVYGGGNWNKEKKSCLWDHLTNYSSSTIFWYLNICDWKFPHCVHKIWDIIC